METLRLGSPSGFVRIRQVALLAFVLSIAACGDNRVPLIDTDIEPVISPDNHLIVTLDNGDQVRLRVRGDARVETVKSECDVSVYEDIGSLTFVENTLAAETFNSPAQENARRAELRTQILQKRAQLEEAFMGKFGAGEYSDPEPKVIDCNLTLQPDDLIHKRLRFSGPSSSNVAITCLGEGDARAQIRNPASVTTLKDEDEDPPMLDFRPSNCGVEPLRDGSSSFVDGLGAVKSRCDPVRNVSISNCRIRGRTDAGSFGGDLAKLSMVRADHVERLRQSAAQHVTFSNVQMAGRYLEVVHLLPGVHHFTIEDSEILGAFLGLTIHLPADGGWNVIKNNTITGQRKRGRWPWSYTGKKREVISVDSSEHNRIVNNHISDMKYGGIKLYRNCGERGGIRHRIPQYNQIINNVFDYSAGTQNDAMIFVGSRDDKSIRWSFGVGVKKYCHEDEGKNGERYSGNDLPMPWDTEVVRNSSESNSDWAQHNVIADNQAIQFKIATAFSTSSSPPKIKLSSKAKKLDNYLIGNEFVRTRSLQEALDMQRTRGAGCAVLAGVTNGMEPPFISNVRNGNIPYIRDNWTVKYFWDIGSQMQLSCGPSLLCQNNMLVINENATCEEPVVRDFGAEAQACNAPGNVCAQGSNAGDEHVLGCRGGKLLGIQAACNLEFGKVTDAQRGGVLLNRVKVIRTSDDKDDGRCTADETRIKEGQRLVLPWLFKRYEGTGDMPNAISYGCKEHDKNGGDCQVNVRHYCEPSRPIQ